MGARKSDADKAKDVEDYIEHVQNIVDFQVSNGMLTKTEADQIQKQLSTASSLTTTNLFTANETAHKAFSELVESVNAKPRGSRLFYMYGLHIWAFILILVAVLLFLLVRQTLGSTMVGGVPMDSLIWGGLGGCGYTIYHLRNNVYEYQLSKYYAIYWFFYPIAGMIFGLAITFVVSSGLFSHQAKPSYSVYATIAHLCKERGRTEFPSS